MRKASCVAIFSLFLTPWWLLGNASENLPTGYQSTVGDVSFQTQGQTLNVSTQSNRAIADYQTFNIGQNHTVNFDLPSSESVILNRVMGGNPSHILGNINANGHVFLVNPSGIVFGNSAIVDVNSLTASTLDIQNDDFLSGRYQFTQGGAPGGIHNMGTLRAAEGGSINLLAGAIQNDGRIIAPSGQINLASGRNITLLLDDTLGVNTQVTGALQEKVADYVSAIQNTGTLSAQGGRVSAKATLEQALYETAINNNGVIEANGFANKAGEIEIVAHASDQSAKVLNSGTIQANGYAPGGNGGRIVVRGDTTHHTGTIEANGNAGGKGGHVQLLGDVVALYEHAKVSANGDTGGGRIEIGGGYQGKTPGVENAKVSFVGADTQVNADALVSGDGGTVVVWADDKTFFNGQITAKGGAVSGNGGFVETSGKHYLDIKGQVDTTAPYGKTGQWLLDPTNVNIVSGCTVDCGGLTDVDSLSDPDIGSGVTNLDVSLINGASSDVSVLASNDINVNAAVNKTAGGLSLSANRHLNVNQSISAAGDVNLTADADFDNTGRLTVSQAVTSTGGTVNLNGAELDIANTVTGQNIGVNASQTYRKDFGVGVTSADSASMTALSHAELANLQTTGTLSIGSLGYTNNFTIAETPITFNPYGAIVLRNDLDTNILDDITTTSQFILFSKEDISVASTGSVTSTAGQSITLRADYDENNTGTLDISGAVVTNDAGINISGSRLNITNYVNPGNSAIGINGGTYSLAKDIYVDNTLVDDNSKVVLSLSEFSYLRGAHVLLGKTTSTPNIVVNEPLVIRANQSLTFNAANTVTVNDNIEITTEASSSKGLTLRTGSGDILINGDITTRRDGASTLDGFVNVSSGGNLTVNGTISSLGPTGVVNLITSNNGNITQNNDISGSTINVSANGSGQIQRTGNVTLTGDTVNLASGSGDIGASGTRIQVAASNLSANTTGDVYVNETDNVTVTGMTGDDIHLTTGSNGNITQTGNITGNTVNLTANGSGQIQQSGSVTVTGSTVNLASGSGDIGSIATRLQVAAGNLSANTSSSGDVYINENNDVTLTGLTGDSISVTTANSGNITLTGNIAAGNTVSLTADGSGQIQRSGIVTITGGNVNFASGSGNIGSSGTPLLTNTSSLSANTTGDVYINETDSVNVVGITGNTVNLTTAGNGSITQAGDIIANTINLTAGGSGQIQRSGNATLTGGTVNLISTTGNIGSSTTALQTNAGSLSANTTGDVYINETDDVTVTGITADDIALTTVGNGNITQTGNIIGTTVNLTADGSGQIQRSGGVTITGNTVNLASSSGDIGSSGTPLQLAAGNLSANTTGNVYLNETDHVTVTGISGSNVNLTTSNNGQITLSGNISGTTVNLNANGNGAILRSGIARVTGTTVNLTSDTGNIGDTFSALNVTADNLSANTTGQITIDEADSVTVTGITGSNVTLTTASNGSITQTGDITGSAVNLIANGSGQIQRSGNVTVTAGTVHLRSDSGDIGSSSTPFQVNAASLSASTTGDVHINEADSVTIGATGLTGDDIHLTTGSNGSITQIGDIIGTTVNLTANGSGNIQRTGAPMITAGTVNLASGSGNIGSNVRPIRVTADNLSANTTGDVYINEIDNVTVTSLSGNNITLRTTNSGGSITQTGNITGNTINLTTASNGSITQAANITGNSVTLSTSGSGQIQRSGNVTVTSGAVNLVSNSGDIGTSSTPLQVATNNLSANSIGDIYINEADDVTVTVTGITGDNITLTTANNGNITQAGNITGTTVNLTANGSGQIQRTGNVTVTGSTVSLTSGSGDIGASSTPLQVATNDLYGNTTGNIYINNNGNTSTHLSGNDITLENNGNIINTLTIATGDVSLTANGGTITDTSTSSSLTTPGNVTLSASNGIGTSPNPLTINVTGILNADSSTGDIYIDSLAATTLLGSITVNGRYAHLEAAGDILDANGSANNIEAGSASLIAGGRIGSESDPLEIDITNGSFSLGSTGSGTGNTVYLNGSILPSGEIIFLSTPSGRVIFNGVTTYDPPSTADTGTSSLSDIASASLYERYYQSPLFKKQDRTIALDVDIKSKTDDTIAVRKKSAPINANDICLDDAGFSSCSR